MAKMRSPAAGWFDSPAVRDAYPPLFNAAQAAELLGISVQTLYHWSSRGWLDDCKAAGCRRLRLSRDCLVAKFLAGRAS